MKNLQNIMLLLFGSLYFLNKMMQKLGLIKNPFLNNHLNDLLCMPLILFLTGWIIIQFKPYSKYRIIPIPAVLALTIYWSVYFEFYLPSNSSQHTGDWIDVAMYFTGAVIFVLIQNFESKQKYIAM